MERTEQIYEKQQAIKKDIQTILDGWKVICTKAHTETTARNTEHLTKYNIMSSEEYGVEFLCRWEGIEVFRRVYNEHRKPYEKDEFVIMQRNTYLEKLETDRKKLYWLTNELMKDERAEGLMAEIKDHLLSTEKILADALEAAWDKHKLTFEFPPFYELKKAVQVYDFDYVPEESIVGTLVCGVLGIKSFEYDISSAMHNLQQAMKHMPEEADRCAAEAVTGILSRKIIEPLEFVLKNV